MKKTVSVLLTLFLFFSSFSVIGFAEGDDFETEPVSPAEESEFSVDDLTIRYRSTGTPEIHVNVDAPYTVTFEPQYPETISVDADGVFHSEPQKTYELDLYIAYFPQRIGFPPPGVLVEVPIFFFPYLRKAPQRSTTDVIARLQCGEEVIADLFTVTVEMTPFQQFLHAITFGLY